MYQVGSKVIEKKILVSMGKRMLDNDNPYLVAFDARVWVVLNFIKNDQIYIVYDFIVKIKNFVIPNFDFASFYMYI